MYDISKLRTLQITITLSRNSVCEAVAIPIIMTRWGLGCNPRITPPPPSSTHVLQYFTISIQCRQHNPGPPARVIGSSWTRATRRRRGGHTDSQCVRPRAGNIVRDTFPNISPHRGYPACPGTAAVTLLKGCRPACGIHHALYVWMIALGTSTFVGTIVMCRL